MDLGLKGKVAIVGASSKGIGKGIALALAQEGANVTICARGKDGLEEAMREIRSSTSSDVLPLVADMSRHQDIKRLVQETASQFGRLDIAVHNSGDPPRGSALGISEEEWQASFERNLLSAMRLAKEAVPHMRKQGGGRIINIISNTVKTPWDGMVISTVTRMGVVGFAKLLSWELAKDNILVNNVCPGSIATDAWRIRLGELAARQKKSFEEIVAQEARDIPLGRFGRLDEIGSAVAFLASEKAGYITGATIHVDGGRCKAVY